MSSIPRSLPTSLFGVAPIGAFMKSAFAPPKKAKKPAVHAQLVKPAGTWPAQPALVESPVDMSKLLAAVKVTPELAAIEWDGDRARAAPAPRELPPLEMTGAAAAAAVAEDEEDFLLPSEFDPAALDPRRRKIRERYIAARFPGVARTLADLQSSDRVIKAARLFFEDDEPELALELLDIAAQEAPHESPIWLARLEILFLTRDAEGFVAAARAFRQGHPRHEQWPEVERLGRALVPGEALFGATIGPRDHEHYGPWPHTPNWIQAPWDLTPEIAAADFHRSAVRLVRRGARV
jgi:hypothetical protein